MVWVTRFCAAAACDRKEVTAFAVGQRRLGGTTSENERTRRTQRNAPWRHLGGCSAAQSGWWEGKGEGRSNLGVNVLHLAVDER